MKVKRRMSYRDEEVKVAYLRGVIQQELKKALEDVAREQGCSFQQVLKMINQIAKAEKADLYDDG